MIIGLLYDKKNHTIKLKLLDLELPCFVLVPCDYVSQWKGCIEQVLASLCDKQFPMYLTNSLSGGDKQFVWGLAK